MCGDVTDAEVIGSSPDLAELWTYLRKPGTQDQYYTVQEFQRIAASRKAELNRELTILPARIDETIKSIPDLEGQPDEEILVRRIHTLEGQKMALMTQAASLTEDDQLQALRRRKGDIELKIANGRVAYRNALELKNKAANEAIRDLGRAVAEADADYIAAENMVLMLTGQIDTLTRERRPCCAATRRSSPGRGKGRPPALPAASPCRRTKSRRHGSASTSSAAGSLRKSTNRDNSAAGP